MKNTIILRGCMNAARQILYIIAFVAIIGFSFTACSNGSTSDGDPEGITFTAKGTFTGGQYILVSDGSRAISASSYSLTGRLSDGSFIYPLTGTYDPVNKTYTASVALSAVRYTINGEIGGSATATKAQDNGGGNWDVTDLPVNTAGTVTIAANDGITGTIVTTNRVPDFALGLWRASGSGYSISATVSPFSYVLNEKYDGSFSTRTEVTVILVELAGSDTYDITVAYYNEIADATRYQKFQAAFSAGNTRMNIRMYYTGDYYNIDFSDVASIGTSLTPYDPDDTLSR
ncbi:MAG: hypothetical protein FWG07_02345 [Treponema sp.]|nr:hypothetical protein [Treponema sp.]